MTKKPFVITNHGFYFIFILLLICAFFMLKPFIVTVISSWILAYVFRPIYKAINRMTKKPVLSSFITIIIMTLIIVLVSSFLITAITSQAGPGIQAIGGFFKNFNTVNCETTTSLTCNIISLGQEYNLDESFGNLVQSVLSYIFGLASSGLLKIPNFLLQFFTMLFITFYFIKDGEKLVNYVFCSLPIKTSFENILIKKFDDVIFATIYGQILTGIIQGIVGGIGFLIFGFPSPFLWGIVMAMAALIPFVGTAIVWVPAATIKLLSNIASQDTSGIISSVLFILYGTLIISGIDNIVKPKIIGDKAKIHPVVILLGVFGGVAWLKVPGIVIGPLILALLVTFIDILNEEREKKCNLK